MAIIYSYPDKTDPVPADKVLISDSEDNNKTKSVKIEDIRSATVSGVSSIIAGTNVTIDPAAGTGDVTINSTSPAPSKVVETVRNTSGSTISKGQPLHITGVSGTTPTVEVADAGDQNKMPVSGLASEDIADNSNGSMILSGILDGVNTSGLAGFPAEAAVVYVNNNTGGSIDYLTASDTTISGQENSVQNIGIIVKNSAGSSGSIQVTAIGRTNATPNLDKGSLFVGNNNNLSRPFGVGTNGHVLTADSTQSSGLSWQAASGGSMSSFLIAGTLGTPQTISDSDTVTFTGGSGISTTAGATDTITITNSLPFTNLEFQADSGSNFNLVDRDILDISGGTGISTLSDGTSDIRVALDNTAVSAGTYGNATNVSQITVDAQGRITNAAQVAISSSGSANGALLHSNIFKGTNSSQTNPPQHSLNEASTTTTALNQVQFSPSGTGSGGTSIKVFAQAARPGPDVDLVRVVFNFSLKHADSDGTPDIVKLFAGLHHTEGNIAPASLTYGWQGGGYTDSDDAVFDVRNYRFAWDIPVASLLAPNGDTATGGQEVYFYLKMSYMDSITTTDPAIIFGQYFKASYSSISPSTMLNGTPLTADVYLLDTTDHNINPALS